MPKKINTDLNEDDLARSLHQLNCIFSDQSMWVPTRARKEHIDLFEVRIPINASYYKRCVGLSSKPLIKLSERSLARLFYCLTAANPQFEVLAKTGADGARCMLDVLNSPGSNSGT